MLLPNLNSNILILILNLPGVDSLGDFRPITLANFQFKIVTKILADMLAHITMQIVSVNQRGFIRDRQIF